MTKTQQQLAGLAALIAVMVAVYARALAPPQHHAHPEQHEQPVVEPSPGASAEPDLAVPAARRMQREKAAQLTWKRDPFTKGAAPGGVGGLTLSGILWDPSRALAIINGQTVAAGEEFEGYRVVSIAQDHVDVSDGSQTFRLQTAP